MISQTLPVNGHSWQSQLVQSIQNLEDLVEYLEIPKTFVNESALNASKAFDLRVPLAFANKMQKGDPADPLLLQVIAQQQENEVVEGFTGNPLLENEYSKVKGILHKYHGRALVTLTGGCAVNCRYCFRREYPYKQNVPRLSEWDQIFNYLTEHNEIFEVILSGGDPLLMPDKPLEKFIQRLNSISSIEILRIHTRFPVVIPERISEELIKILQQSNKKLVFVLHINHPNEICDDLKAKIRALIRIGCMVFNQSVLLKGVNDNPKILAELSKKLIATHITPYYLHLLDKVKGSHMFYVPDETAYKIYNELITLVPGYFVPKLVREIPGKPFKVPCNFIY